MSSSISSHQVGAIIEPSSEPVPDSIFGNLLKWANHHKDFTLDFKKDVLDKLGEGSSQGFWHYAGSLTTPPCSKIVEWVFLRNPLKMDGTYEGGVGLVCLGTRGGDCSGGGRGGGEGGEEIGRGGARNREEGAVGKREERGRVGGEESGGGRSVGEGGGGEKGGE